MLTTADTPAEISHLYDQSKILAGKIIDSVLNDAVSTRLESSTELNASHPSSIIYVRDGMFKYMCGDRFVRFYANGDIVTTLDAPSPSVTIISEFASDIVIVKKTDFLRLLSHNDTVSQMWFSYQQTIDFIMHVLCSLYIGEAFNPHIDLRKYKVDEHIITEGERPDNLFEMIEGNASVSVKGTTVGVVREGDTFGEVSFLTGHPRSATVIAQTDCLVQAIHGKDFEKIVRFRPGLIFSLSKTLARRLTEVNEQLTKISSLT
jgi:hypothetical protein